MGSIFLHLYLRRYHLHFELFFGEQSLLIFCLHENWRKGLISKAHTMQLDRTKHANTNPWNNTRIIIRHLFSKLLPLDIVAVLTNLTKRQLISNFDIPTKINLFFSFTALLLMWWILVNYFSPCNINKLQ